MRQILLAIGLMTVILTGCGTTSPYLEVGVGYALDDNIDWYLRTERCPTPVTALLEVGLEFQNNLSVGYRARVDERPELYQEEIIITKRWGGGIKKPPTRGGKSQ